MSWLCLIHIVLQFTDWLSFLGPCTARACCTQQGGGWGGEGECSLSSKQAVSGTLHCESMLHTTRWWLGGG